MWEGMPQALFLYFSLCNFSLYSPPPINIPTHVPLMSLTFYSPCPILTPFPIFMNREGVIGEIHTQR